MTSRWILEVEKIRGVKVTLHTMGLYILNKGRGLDPNYRERIDAALVTSRAAAAVQKLHGRGVLRSFYIVLGTRLHPGGEPAAVETVAAALIDCDLEAGIVGRVITDKFDTGLHAYQKMTQGPVGTDVGTPVIRISGIALLGPVISPVPKSEAAGELFDDFVKVTVYPGFFELKRSRDISPIFD